MVTIASSLVQKQIVIDIATINEDCSSFVCGNRGNRRPPKGVIELIHCASLYVFRRTFHFYTVSRTLAVWLFRHVADYDVIHIHSLFSFSSTVAALASMIADIPYIVRPLGTIASYGRSNRRRYLKAISVRFIEGPILRRAAAVHFTSELEMSDAKNLGIPFRGVVIPVATHQTERVDSKIFLRDFFSGVIEDYILFLGRLDPIKNVEGMLLAFSIIKNKYPRLKLVISGSGESDYVCCLKEFAGKLGVSDNVLWTGFIDGKLKASAMACAKLFCLPSHSESYGIAAAEALSAGLPCVLGNNVGIAKDVVAAGAGRAVNPSGPDIAIALLYYLENPDAWEAASTAARQYAICNLSIEVMGQRLFSLYESVRINHNM